MNDPGFKDYKEKNQLYSTCSCKGRISEGKPLCERNRDKQNKHDGQGYCMYYRINGTLHCDHRYPPDKQGETKEELEEIKESMGI